MLPCMLPSVLLEQVSTLVCGTTNWQGLKLRSVLVEQRDGNCWGDTEGLA